MNLSDAKLSVGVMATAPATTPGTSGKVRVGLRPTSVRKAEADLVHVFTVEATTVADVATLDFTTGVVTATVGAPTVVGGDGKDFEGETMPSLAVIYGVLVEGLSATGADILIGSTLGLVEGSVAQDGYLQWVGARNAPGDLTITPQVVGNKVRVTVLGKTPG